MADLNRKLYKLQVQLEEKDKIIESLKQEHEQYKLDQERKYNTLKQEYEQYRQEHP